MVLTPVWVAGVGRAIVWVVFVCRLGRVARLASPHDTARFTSMVFTLGVMALLDLFGRVFTPLPQESTDESTKHAFLCVGLGKLRQQFCDRPRRHGLFACQVDKRKRGFTSMVCSPARVARVGRAVVSVVFVCRLGRVAGLASPRDTTRFISMVFDVWRNGLA